MLFSYIFTMVICTGVNRKQYKTRGGYIICIWGKALGLRELQEGRSQAEGKWVEAIASLAEAVKLARQEARPDLEVQAYDLIGVALIKKGDGEKAEKYLVKAIELANAKQDQLGLAATLKVFTHLSFHKGDRETAAKNLASMLEIAEKAELDAYKGFALVGLAHLANDAGDLGHAIEEFKKGIDLLERTEGAEAKHELAKAYNGLADAMETAGDHARALTYFEKAKEGFLKENNRLGRALAEVGVAECCTRLGFVVRAMEQLETARSELIKLRDDAGVGEVYRISGALMTAQSNWAAARSHLDKSVNLFSRDKTNPRFIIGLVRARAEIGRMYYSKGEMDQGDAAFKLARELSEKAGSKRLLDFVEKVYRDSLSKSLKK